MPKTLSRPPKYCCQKQTGRPDRAYVKVDGKRIMLGNYGSPESYEKYAEAISGNTSKDVNEEAQPAPAIPTVAMLMADYLEFAIDKYGGEKASEVVHLKGALRILKDYFSDTLARDFTGKTLRRVQRLMVAEGWTRGYVNDQCQRIKRMTRWGVVEEIVPASTQTSLEAVEGLEPGEFGVKDNEEKRPVPQELIDGTVAELPETAADMVQIQILTGMRTGELVQLSNKHIDRTGEVWLFSPPRHKTKKKGKTRCIAIGPQAQAILSKYLFAEPCFNYTVAGYRRAIARACVRAFPHPELSQKEKLTKAEERHLREWRKEHHWHPHRLRHNAGTAIRDALGIEHAQSALGHSKADMTEVYARVNIERAIEAARQIG
ncbi:tyrosine-type recombinase/integrase [Aeoliella sp.]|uniref:tyrosine-type recombinase/integrase n=1 Tax=Aeoliella sp. TaxID=2795800 RepID=UPI003CCC1C8F